MLIIANQQNTRQSSRKVRLVANQVKKLHLQEAISQLALIERRSSLAILKVINQALANAIKNHQLPATDLQLKDIIVNDGPIYKRMRAVARGQGHRIEKRTCHIQVILESVVTGDNQINNHQLPAPSAQNQPSKKHTETELNKSERN